MLKIQASVDESTCSPERPTLKVPEELAEYCGSEYVTQTEWDQLMNLIREVM